MKIFKQSGRQAQIVVFLAFLIVCCLGAMGSLIAVASFKGVTLPAMMKTATSTATVQATLTSTPLPEILNTLTPLPGQWTATPTFLPGQLTNTPTRAPILRTVAPTVELFLFSGTPTPVIRETLTPEADKNLRLIQIKSTAYQSAYRSFFEFHQQLGADSKLMGNEGWKTQMVAALARLEESARQLADVKLPDPNYAAYASYLDKLYAETGFMVNAYRKGLDRFDPASLHIAAVHLQAMNDVQAKADQEFKAVKSRLATPAFSSGPSWTPDR